MKRQNMALGHSLALLNFKCGFLFILIVIVAIVASISHYENFDCSFCWLLAVGC